MTQFQVPLFYIFSLIKNQESTQMLGQNEQNLTVIHWCNGRILELDLYLTLSTWHFYIWRYLSFSTNCLQKWCITSYLKCFVWNWFIVCYLHQNWFFLVRYALSFFSDHSSFPPYSTLLSIYQPEIIFIFPFMPLSHKVLSFLILSYICKHHSLNHALLIL